MEIRNRKQAEAFIAHWENGASATRAARVFRHAAEGMRTNVAICLSNNWLESAKGYKEAAEALEDAARRLDPEAV